QDDRTDAARPQRGEGQSSYRDQSQSRARTSRQWLNVMSEKVLKIVPQAKKSDADVAATGQETKAGSRFGRKRLRLILLVAIPLILLLGGGIFYLSGGRYISTDNAYVGAQKVLITPEISG